MHKGDVTIKGLFVSVFILIGIFSMVVIVSVDLSRSYSDYNTPNISGIANNTFREMNQTLGELGVKIEGSNPQEVGTDESTSEYNIIQSMWGGLQLIARSPAIFDAIITDTLGAANIHGDLAFWIKISVYGMLVAIIIIIIYQAVLRAPSL